MTGAPLVAQRSVDGCPMVIHIDSRGAVFENRMQGMFRVSFKTMESDLKGGCKKIGPVSSVVVNADHAAPQSSLQRVTDLIHRFGPAGVSVKVNH
jgi:biopolymer transport protein ExbD